MTYSPRFAAVSIAAAILLTAEATQGLSTAEATQALSTAEQRFCAATIWLPFPGGRQRTLSVPREVFAVGLAAEQRAFDAVQRAAAAFNRAAGREEMVQAAADVLAAAEGARDAFATADCDRDDAADRGRSRVFVPGWDLAKKIERQRAIDRHADLVRAQKMALTLWASPEAPPMLTPDSGVLSLPRFSEISKPQPSGLPPTPIMLERSAFPMPSRPASAPGASSSSPTVSARYVTKISSPEGMSRSSTPARKTPPPPTSFGARVARTSSRTAAPLTRLGQ